MIRHPKADHFAPKIKEPQEATREEVVVAAAVTPPEEQTSSSEEEKKFLTESQIGQLDNSHLRSKIINMDRVMIEMRIQMEEKDLRLLQADFKEKTNAIKERAAQLTKRLEQLKADDANQKAKNKETIYRIAKEHGIPSDKAFSYHPETYEIILDNE